MNQSDFEKWEIQLRKGLIELVVMQALARQQPAHGYALLSQIDTAGLRVSEGTLYPLLNRLDKNGWLTSRWQTPADESGTRPRRYYQLSPGGARLLPAMQRCFDDLRLTVDTLRTPQ